MCGCVCVFETIRANSWSHELKSLSDRTPITFWGLGTIKTDEGKDHEENWHALVSMSVHKNLFSKNF